MRRFIWLGQKVAAAAKLLAIGEQTMANWVMAKKAGQLGASRASRYARWGWRATVCGRNWRALRWSRKSPTARTRTFLGARHQNETGLSVEVRAVYATAQGLSVPLHRKSPHPIRLWTQAVQSLLRTGWSNLLHPIQPDAHRNFLETGFLQACFRITRERFVLNSRPPGLYAIPTRQHQTQS